MHCFFNFFFNYIILVNVLDESNICFITDTTFNLKQCFIYKKKKHESEKVVKVYQKCFKKIINTLVLKNMKIQTKWVCKIFFQVLKIDNKRKRKKVFTLFFFQMNFYCTMSYKCKNT